MGLTAIEVGSSIAFGIEILYLGFVICWWLMLILVYDVVRLLEIGLKRSQKYDVAARGRIWSVRDAVFILNLGEELSTLHVWTIRWWSSDAQRDWPLLVGEGTSHNTVVLIPQRTLPPKNRGLPRDLQWSGYGLHKGMGWLMDTCFGGTFWGYDLPPGIPKSLQLSSVVVRLR